MQQDTTPTDAQLCKPVTHWKNWCPLILSINAQARPLFLPTTLHCLFVTNNSGTLLIHSTYVHKWFLLITSTRCGSGTTAADGPVIWSETFTLEAWIISSSCRAARRPPASTLKTNMTQKHVSIIIIMSSSKKLNKRAAVPSVLARTGF